MSKKTSVVDTMTIDAKTVTFKYEVDNGKISGKIEGNTSIGGATSISVISDASMDQAICVNGKHSDHTELINKVFVEIAAIRADYSGAAQTEGE